MHGFLFYVAAYFGVSVLTAVALTVAARVTTGYRTVSEKTGISIGTAIAVCSLVWPLTVAGLAFECVEWCINKIVDGKAGRQS